MKYLITDTEEHTLGEINDYFVVELKKTNLQVSDIIIDKTLKVKIGMVELERIFDENGMAEFYQLGLGIIHLNLTGHTIEFTDNEIQSRFEDAFYRTIENLKNELQLLK